MKVTFKKILLLASVVAVIGMIVALSMYFKPHKNITKQPADFELPADKLYTDFEDAEETANEKYVDKIIQVEGSVAGVTTSPAGAVNITLYDDFFGVSCSMDSTFVKENLSLIEQLKTGDNLTLKGICSGMLTDVKLSRCIIVKE